MALKKKKQNGKAAAKKRTPIKNKTKPVKPSVKSKLSKEKNKLKDSTGKFRIGGKFISIDIQKKLKGAKTEKELKKIIASVKRKQPKQLRGNNGKFLSKKETEFLKTTLKKQKGKKDLKKAQKKLADKFRWVETSENINASSLRAVILSPEYDNKKIIIKDIWGEETEMSSNFTAIEIVEDQNTHLYNIIDLIRQNEGEVISPHFTPLLIQRIKLGDTTNVNGIVVAPRVLRIDYNDKHTIQSLSRATWDKYKELYKNDNL